ncbi:tripartite tricarboxylate transporter TctB family protein [Denitrobaculum tricleocarpae]|uniref:tripartite tricarboxylate transporter TctB family protein n=1 Tax=Denitrobaculum tricleocarpae TaxID=2591009 RepID=UPI0015D0EB31|nr:tripartite tricarboxylate transporter TctB family protein [Denitrobaculum tricleocarpae]
MSSSDHRPDGQTLTVSISPLFSTPVLEWLFWLVLAGMVYALTDNFDEPIAEYQFGASGWPRVLCAALAFGATAQLLYKLTRRRAEREKPADPSSGQESKPAHSGLTLGAKLQRAGVFLVPFLYLYVMPEIGFYVATPFFILAILLLLEVRSIKALISVTAVVHGLVLLIFTRFFYVALPVGRVEGFYDLNNWIIAFVRTGM